MTPAREVENGAFQTGDGAFQTGDGAFQTGDGASRTVTRSGLTVQDTGSDSGFRRTAAALLDRSPDSLPPETAVLFANGTVSVLLSTDQIPAGRATVTGDLIYDHAAENATGGPALSVLNVTSASVDTDPRAASVDDVVAEERVGHFEFTDDLRMTGVATAPSASAPWTVQTGYLGGEQLSHRLLAYPGIVARSTVLADGLSEARRRVGTDLNGGLRTRTTGHPFWIDASATVTGVRVDPDPAVFGSSDPPLFVTRVDVENGTTVPAERLAAAPELYEGSVVTVETRSTGLVRSAAGLLAEPEHCSGEYERRRGDTCYRLPVDVAVHGGVLLAGTAASGDGRATLPYAGLSARSLPASERDESGRYRITGRVVPAGTVDPRLESAHALLVYEREPIGPGESGSVENGSIGDGSVENGSETATSTPTETVGANRSPITGPGSERARQVAEYLAWQVESSYSDREALYELADDGTDEHGVELAAVEYSSEVVTAGAPVSLTATLSNGAASSRSVTLSLRGDDVVYDTVSVRLSGGANETVRFEFAIFETGTHRLSINNWSAGTVLVSAAEDTVSAESGNDRSGMLGGLADAMPADDHVVLAVALLVGAAIAGLLRRREGT